MPYNPRSRQNLKPRELYYQEPKKRHEVTVTPEGWEGFQSLAESHGVSCSELIERLGRGLISLDGPQGDVLEVMSWGNVHCRAKDALGNEYACKRVKDASA